MYIGKTAGEGGKMQTNDAVKAIMAKAGKSAYTTSLDMGRKHSFITTTLKRKGGIGAPVLSDIASACGYRLVLVPDDHMGDVERGGGIVIDGTTKAE